MPAVNSNNSNRSTTRGRTPPALSRSASASSADVGAGSSDDVGAGSSDDAGARSSADAVLGTVNASISGYSADDRSRTASSATSESSADAGSRTASDSPSHSTISSSNTTIYPSTNPANTLSSTTVATSVGVVSAAMINHTDLIARANMFLRNCNIQDKIILAPKILRQQVEINF
jgi:hypothetical protein